MPRGCDTLNEVLRCIAGIQRHVPCRNRNPWNQVVKGLDLSLFDMCVGERRRIEIPARLAYGNKGSKVFGIPPEDGTVRAQEESRG